MNPLRNLGSALLTQFTGMGIFAGGIIASASILSLARGPKALSMPLNGRTR
jgi:hypothetical protein